MTGSWVQHSGYACLCDSCGADLVGEPPWYLVIYFMERDSRRRHCVVCAVRKCRAAVQVVRAREVSRG